MEYEQLLAQRDKYKHIKDTADTLSISDRDGAVIELTGAEPLAAVGTYVDAKMAEIDIAISKITLIDAVKA